MLVIRLHCRRGLAQSAVNALHKRLEEFGRITEFDTVDVSQAHHNGPYTWQGGRLAAMPRDESPGLEKPVQQNGVVAYPAHSEFSRYLAGADAYVEITEPFFSDWSRKLDPKLEQDVKMAVEQLGLKRHDKINFNVRVVNNREIIQPLLRELDRLAKSIGFKGSAVGMGYVRP